MRAKDAQAERACPGERYTISVAICRTRQRNQYPKCLLCPHRDPEVAGSIPSDPKVSSSIFHSTSVSGAVPNEINDYVIRKIGQAAAQFLRSQEPGSSRLAVACDARDNSRSFARAFSEGVTRGGADVVNLGTVPPGALAYALGADGYGGGAFIGGGNRAGGINGVRLWRSEAQLVGFGSGLDKIGLIARRMRLGRSRLPGEMHSVDLLADYLSYLKTFAPDLRPLAIVMDGGNGAAGRVARRLVADLPIELIPMHFEEDGRSPFLGKEFPAPAVVAAVREGLRRHEAGCGAAFDFNAERVVFFDETGAPLRHDLAAALIATEMLARNPGGAVALDLRFSAALQARITQKGGQALRAPASRLEFAQHFRRNEALYGVDGTGLHYFRDFYRFPSPFLALLMFASNLSRDPRPVSQQVAELEQWSQSGEVVIPLPSAEVGQVVLEHIRSQFQHAEREMIDGLSVRTQEWWFNLRQPAGAAELRLNVEAKSRRQVRQARQNVEKLIKNALAESNP